MNSSGCNPWGGRRLFKKGSVFSQKMTVAEFSRVGKNDQSTEYSKIVKNSAYLCTIGCFIDIQSTGQFCSVNRIQSTIKNQHSSFG